MSKSCRPCFGRNSNAARAGLKVRVVEGTIFGGPCGEGRCTPVVKRASQYDTVVAGNWFSLLTCNSAGRSATRAIEDSGTCEVTPATVPGT